VGHGGESANDDPQGYGSGLPLVGDPSIVPRTGLSPLALTSVVAPVVLGPVGAVAAIIFGWAARRESMHGGPRRPGQVLATVGMCLGVIMTMLWGAALAAAAWAWRYRSSELFEPPPSPPSLAVDQGSPRAAAPEPAPSESVPKQTTLRHEGAIAVVDIGASISTLAGELARQRAAAAPLKQTVLVMTTRDKCEPCREMMRLLNDPLMQTALVNVRLVRVNIELFGEDLDELKIPRERLPGFFLLKLDLTPSDGIDEGEWDADIAQNIAPVLGAFVRHNYAMRRQPWRTVPGSGVRL
jgi:hypothetical protein